MNSIDSIECDDIEEESQYNMEYINSITPSGMPPHKLNIKIGSIVMLLRNVNMSQGLCNGTRLIVRQIYTDLIDVEIISGSGKQSKLKNLFHLKFNINDNVIR